MGKIKEWFMDHLDEYSDEELADMGYSEEEIAFLRGNE